MSGQFVSILFDRSTEVVGIQHYISEYTFMMQIRCSLEIRSYEVGSW